MSRDGYYKLYTKGSEFNREVPSIFLTDWLGM